MLFNLTATASYGFNNFFPSIVQGFNMGSRTVTLLLTAPPYVFGAICSLFVCYNSDKRKERGYHICIGLSVAIIGFIVSATTLAQAARYTAAFLYIGGIFSINPLIYAWLLSTLQQTPEKKAASAAVVNVFGHFGNIISPQFFPASDEPRYLMAMLLMMSMAIVAAVMSGVVKITLIRENKKLRRDADARGVKYNPYTL
jgi:drug/metabolite transporter superfamily protein YnfA